MVSPEAVEVVAKPMYDASVAFLRFRKIDIEIKIKTILFYRGKPVTKCGSNQSNQSLDREDIKQPATVVPRRSGNERVKLRDFRFDFSSILIRIIQCNLSVFVF